MSAPTGSPSGVATQHNAFAAAEDARSGLKRDIGPVGLLFAGVGSIIGSGWLFGAFKATHGAGPAAIFAWVIGAVMILLIGLVFSELGSMFPVSGGVVRFPHYSHGSFASFTMGWVTWLAAAVVAPIEVLGALTYATSYAHWITNADGTLTWPRGYLIATAGMLLFSFINMIGIGFFARINNVIVWWKLAIILLTVFALLFTTFHASNFTSHGFAPSGLKGMFHTIVVAGIVFSFLGFRQGVELGGETNNPRRNIPLAVVGSIVLCALIYILLQVAYIGALPGKELANGWASVGLNIPQAAGPLAWVASLIGLGWLSKLLLADAVISPADTGFIYMTVTTRLSYAMARNDNAPKVFAKTSKRGVPWASVILAFVVGLIIFLPFPSWNKLVGFVTNSTVLSFGSGSVVLMSMRQQFPNQERPFRLPGGHIVPFLAFFSANQMIYWAGWDTNWRLFVAVLIGLVILGVQMITRPGGMPDMHWRNGWWILVWFAGLAIISWQGIYSSDDLPHGQQNNIPFGWDFAVNIVFSAAIYALAIRYRLTPHEARTQVEETPVDDPEGTISGTP